MHKIFEFEFIDRSSKNQISFEYDDDVDEEIDIKLEKGKPILYANQQAFLSLAKAFIQLAMGNYGDGFHIHVRKDFDADKPEIICCVLKHKM